MPRSTRSQTQRRERQAEGSTRESVRQTAPMGGSPDILALQRHAGNRAVDALLSGVQGQVPPIVEEVLRSGSGQPLDPAAQGFMEERFGEDFSQVRVHTDAKAAESAAVVNAKAYTVGRDVVFGTGEYQPQKGEGKQLLAHELAHVAQNRRAGNRNHLQQGSALSQPSHLSEREAAMASEQVTAGQHASITSVSVATIQRAKRSTRPDQPSPEQTSINITGHYEAADPRNDSRITLQINQAGHYFEGWYQQRYRSDTQRLAVRRMVGELVSDQLGKVTFRYLRYHETGIYRSNGVLTAAQTDEGIKLTLAEPTGQQDFHRVSRAARLAEEAIASTPEPARGLVRAAETAPLDSEDEEEIYKGAQRIAGLIQEYLSEDAGVKHLNVVKRIDGYVPLFMSRFAPEQHPLVVRNIQGLLLENSVPKGKIDRPYWDWLQIIVSSHPENHTGHIQKHFGVYPRGDIGPNSPQHKYSWKFWAWGAQGDVAFGLGLFFGQFTIRKVAPEQWTEDYFTVLATGSVGLSVGGTFGQFTGWNDLQAPFPWSSGNFKGEFLMLGSSFQAAFAGGFNYSPAAAIIFYGDHTYPPIIGDAGGDVAAVFGIGGGAEVGLVRGELWGGREEAIRSTGFQQQLRIASSYGVATVTGFPVNEPSLTLEGREAIRRMCALHRSALENPASTIRIDGYASTTGSESFNKGLSDLRARNTLQAIHDVLGPAFALPQKHIQLKAHGEMAARQAGSPENTEDPSWRKVEVRINGHVVLVLQ